MANDKSKKSNGNVDSVSWVVKDTTGTQVGKENYPGYKEASTAARSHTRESGLFAQAVRS